MNDPHAGLSWEKLTERRREAFRLFSLSVIPARVAELLNVTRTSACRWKHEFIAGGDGSGYRRAVPSAPKPLAGRVELPLLSALDAARFWRHVVIGGPDECWPWTSNSLPFGHGLFKIKIHGRWTNVVASRVALFLHIGESFDHSMDVLHSCDYPPCCNFFHLRNGTAKDNAVDCVVRQRQRPSPKALNELQVNSIREQRRRGASLRSLAVQYGVAHATIRRAIQ